MRLGPQPMRNNNNTTPPHPQKTSDTKWKVPIGRQRNNAGQLPLFQEFIPGLRGRVPSNILSWVSRENTGQSHPHLTWGTPPTTQGNRPPSFSKL